MNYTIIRAWTDARNRWFTVAWADGRQTTHCVPDSWDSVAEQSLTGVRL